MPVNVAFGPSAGLVGQFGYKTGARQYSDQKAQIERQSKRQMLSDAMNFAKYVQDVRRPEEDQRRTLERMQKQQTLQKDTLTHQSQIKKTDYIWEQEKKNDLRDKQNQELIDLDKRLKNEIKALPADISPLERQQYYQRQYQFGAHKIGLAKPPGADIKPFKHYVGPHGDTHRINQDGSYTNVTAEKAKIKSERQKANTAMITSLSTAKIAVETAAAKPFDDEIVSLENRRKEHLSKYEGPASLEDTVPAPVQENYMTSEDKPDTEAFRAATEKHQKISANSESTYRAHHAELEAIDKAIREAKRGRTEAVNLSAMKLYRSVGGEDNLGGTMGGSLFDDSVRDAERIKKARIEEEQKDAERARDIGLYTAAQRNPEARKRFIEEPPTGIIPESYSDFPHERREEAERLLEQGGPTPGPDFKLDSGKMMSDTTMRGIQGSTELRHLYSDQVTDKDMARYAKEHEEANPVAKRIVPDAKGKSVEKSMKADDAKATEEAWKQRATLQKSIEHNELMLAKSKNERIRPDIVSFVKVSQQMAKIQEDRHTKLLAGGGDILAKETAMTQNSKLKEYRKLKKKRAALRATLVKLQKGELAGERFQKHLREFREAATTDIHGSYGSKGIAPKGTPMGYVQRWGLDAAIEAYSIFERLFETEGGPQSDISHTGRPPKRRGRPQTGVGSAYDPSEFGT